MDARERALQAELTEQHEASSLLRPAPLVQQVTRPGPIPGIRVEYHEARQDAGRDHRDDGEVSYAHGAIKEWISFLQSNLPQGVLGNRRFGLGRARGRLSSDDKELPTTSFALAGPGQEEAVDENLLRDEKINSLLHPVGSAIRPQ